MIFFNNTYFITNNLSLLTSFRFEINGIKSTNFTSKVKL